MRLGTAWACAVGLALACAAPRPAVLAQTPPSTNVCNVTAPGRIVAIGDVHGAFDKYVTILREAGLIDGRRRWIGGNAVFVQIGDVLDRGPQSREALDMLRTLETEAQAAGGRVVFLLGNHEVMRMQGDLRYVSDEEYDSFKNGGSAELRERFWQHQLTQMTAAARAAGQTFNAAEERILFLRGTPLGSVEMQIAFSESGEYGKWLREHDIMARVNGIAFVHGGPSPAFATRGCEGTNAKIRSDLKTVKITDRDYDKTFLWHPDGPLWYRGLISDSTAPATPEEVTEVLKSLGASKIVLGHTVSLGKVRSHFDGRVFQIDTGMLNGAFYPGGLPSALEIKDGTFTAIYPGKREVLR